MDNAVIVQNLHKHYGTVRAVDDVSFTVAPGEVLALLGPNGAGKTTVVEVLEGHRRRTSGQVSVLGQDPGSAGRSWRERIGIVLQEAGFDEQFSVRELVALQASYYPKPRAVTELIAEVGLAEKAEAKVKTLSGGQRRRLDLALGLAGRPELLFLDEPTTGFDPSARLRAWELIGSFRGSGTTVLLTTHYLEEAEQLADRVAVLQQGRIVAIGTPGELTGATGGGAVISFRLPHEIELDQLPAIGRGAEVAGTSVRIRTDRPTADLHELTAWALQRGVELGSLELGRPTLEEAYLQLTGTGNG